MSDWRDGAVEGADVVVIATQSRALAPEAAYEAAAGAASELRAAGARPLYKNIDPTMRGPVGAEIDAVMGFFALDVAAVCPPSPTTPGWWWAAICWWAASR